MYTGAINKTTEYSKNDKNYPLKYFTYKVYIKDDSTPIKLLFVSETAFYSWKQ